MLEFDSAAKRFGPVTALDGCTFTARPSRLTGFLGPNGAGKTTAMRTVFGLVELDAGGVRWRGAPISGAERARFGYMPEERGLYPRMRVREQLVYLGQLCGGTSKAVGRVADRWLERLGVADRASDRLDALSHGNQQRVQLIAALVNEPDLIVLDEPFSGLDPIAMEAMAGLLAELAAAGATVLFSSHQLDLVEDLCEDVVIIDHGRVVLAGELVDLRSAVPERFVDVRYRGPAPDWSRLAAVRGRRGGRRPGPAAGRRRRRPGRRWWPPSGTPVICSPSPTSLRRCRSCSAGWWRHERVAPRLAGRGPGDAGAEPLRRLPGRPGGHARGRRRDGCPAVADRHLGGHQGCRPGRRLSGRPFARHPPAGRRPSGSPCGCARSTAWPPGETPSGRDASTCSWSTRDGWSGRADPTSSCRRSPPAPSSWSPFTSGQRPLASVPRIFARWWRRCPSRRWRSAWWPGVVPTTEPRRS